MTDGKITWAPLLDHHVRGECSLGAVWIRLDRQDLVTGIYTMFGSVKKIVPSDQEPMSLELGKLAAELDLLVELDNRNSFLVH
jgi:hypothetical protein